MPKPRGRKPESGQGNTKPQEQKPSQVPAKVDARDINMEPQATKEKARRNRRRKTRQKNKDEHAVSQSTASCSNPLSCHSSAMAHETVDYSVVREELKLSSHPVLFSGMSASRLMNVIPDVKTAALKNLTAEFKAFYETQNSFGDGKTHQLYCKKILEFNYFAHLPSEEGNTRNAEPSLQGLCGPELMKAVVTKNRVDSSRMYADGNQMKVLIFELYTDPSKVGYKLAQLEARLAYYRAYREVRKKDYDGHVAHCGLVLPRPNIADVMTLVADPETMCVHIDHMFKMNKFCLFPSRAFVDPTIGTPSTKFIPDAPASVWVRGQNGGTAFKVSPATDDIDALKDAIKAEIGPKYPTLIAPDITIYEPGDATKKVVKQSTPLVANTEENPYLFELPGSEEQEGKKSKKNTEEKEKRK